MGGIDQPSHDVLASLPPLILCNLRPSPQASLGASTYTVDNVSIRPAPGDAVNHGRYHAGRCSSLVCCQGGE